LHPIASTRVAALASQGTLPVLKILVPITIIEVSVGIEVETSTGLFAFQDQSRVDISINVFDLSILQVLEMATLPSEKPE
jgi:hypothetical protein